MADLLRVGRVCALILAGGRSRRMGLDKPLMRLDDNTLLERAADFWRGCGRVSGVLAAVGAPGHLPTLPEGVRPVYDLYPGCGPMAGLHAAFAQTDAELVYVSAVDMPYLTREALLPEPRGQAAVYVKDGLPEPLFGVYRRTCLPALEMALQGGQHKMTTLLKMLDTEYVDLPEAFRPVLENLNTPEDMLRARAGTPPTVVFCGWSGSGKTTFIEKLIPVLTEKGLRVAVLKHDGHGFSMDRPGKDTWRFARAGAVSTGIAGPNGWALLGADHFELSDLKRRLPPTDIVLAEGFKSSVCPKIEVFRRAVGKPFIPYGDGSLLAVVTDAPGDFKAPVLGLDDVEACARLILKTFLPEVTL